MESTKFMSLMAIVLSFANSMVYPYSCLIFYLLRALHILFTESLTMIIDMMSLIS